MQRTLNFPSPSAVTTALSPRVSTEAILVSMPEALTTFQIISWSVADAGWQTACYSGLDFGDYGSDEITVSVFANSNDPQFIQFWEGLPGGEDSELLYDGVYHKQSQWQVFQPETYKLKKRLRGQTTLYICTKSSMELGGFTFTRINKVQRKAVGRVLLLVREFHDLVNAFLSHKTHVNGIVGKGSAAADRDPANALLSKVHIRVFQRYIVADALDRPRSISAPNLPWSWAVSHSQG